MLRSIVVLLIYTSRDFIQQVQTDDETQLSSILIAYRL